MKKKPEETTVTPQPIYEEAIPPVEIGDFALLLSLWVRASDVQFFYQNFPVHVWGSNGNFVFTDRWYGEQAIGGSPYVQISCYIGRTWLSQQQVRFIMNCADKIERHVMTLRNATQSMPALSSVRPS